MYFLHQALVRPTKGVAVIRPMELDLKCLKTTYWNKTYGIGPINEVGIRPTDT